MEKWNWQMKSIPKHSTRSPSYSSGIPALVWSKGSKLNCKKYIRYLLAVKFFPKLKILKFHKMPLPFLESRFSITAQVRERHQNDTNVCKYLVTLKWKLEILFLGNNLFRDHSEKPGLFDIFKFCPHLCRGSRHFSMNSLLITFQNFNFFSFCYWG